MQCKQIVTVSDKAARSLRSGHPWVYEAEVLDVQETIHKEDVTSLYRYI